MSDWVTEWPAGHNHNNVETISFMWPDLWLADQMSGWPDLGEDENDLAGHDLPLLLLEQVPVLHSHGAKIPITPPTIPAIISIDFIPVSPSPAQEPRAGFNWDISVRWMWLQAQHHAGHESAHWVSPLAAPLLGWVEEHERTILNFCLSLTSSCLWVFISFKKVPETGFPIHFSARWRNDPPSPPS